MTIEIVKVRKSSLTEEEIKSLKRVADLFEDINALDTTDSCWEDFEKDSTTCLTGWEDAVDFLNELIEYIEDERENTLIFEEEIVE